MFQDTALLYWLAETARAMLVAADGREVVTLVRDRVETLMRAEVCFYRRFGAEIVSVADLDGDARGEAKTESAIARGFAQTHSAVTGSRVIVPIVGSDDAVRWVLEARFPGSHAIVDAEVFALDLIGAYVAGAAKKLALVRELEESRAAILRLAILKSDLVTILAHDFKSPLTTVMGYAELLADGGLDDATRGDAVGAIQSASRKLASLANDTLALSRLDASELALDLDSVDICSVIEDAAQTFALDRAVRLETSTRPVVFGDAQRLRQVFENLIGNAIKFSPEGEDVRVAVTAVDRAIAVTVRDRGIGVPEAEIGLLFERFARASNARTGGIEGTGLGLFLARSLVASHGGTIALANATDGGTIATVLLPEAAAFVERPLPRTLVIAKPTDAVAFVAYALRTSGYAVRVAATLDEARLRLKRDAYDLAIVDAASVDPDGAAEVLRASVGAPIPRILIAAANNGASSNGSDANGWAEIVRTPYLASDVLSVVERVVGIASAR